MIGAGGFGLRKCILIESDLRAFDHSTFSEVKIFLQLFACTCAMMFYLILFRQAPNIILIANIFLPKLSVCVTRITISSLWCNLLKALLDDCNVSRVKLFPTSFVGQTHQEQRFPVILRDMWLGWGGQGSKEIRALKTAWTQPRK